jgi:hypothetical protein
MPNALLLLCVIWFCWLSLKPAGKYGQLGHGDTSKRTVGRLVKQLRHLDVLQVSNQLP